MKPAAVFLDRDGVLNRALVREGKPYPPHDPAEFELLPGVAETLATLRAAGLRLIVVTNQPDVARGTLSQEAAEAINARLQQCLPVHAVYACYHDNHHGCVCRKPKPGMLLQASTDWGLALERSYMVGDRWSDIAAGNAAGCRTVLIDYQYNEPLTVEPDLRAPSLSEAGAWILNRHSQTPTDV